MDNVLVQMEGIDKRFPGVHALDNCRFELRAAEVHALCGENGAGKSTMMKILSGIYPKDAGRILYKGREVEIDSPKAAQLLGISIIHQELNLMPHLTVAQNIFIGREPRKGLRFLLDDKAINEQTSKLFESMHLKDSAMAMPLASMARLAPRQPWRKAKNSTGTRVSTRA